MQCGFAFLEAERFGLLYWRHYLLGGRLRLRVRRHFSSFRREQFFFSASSTDYDSFHANWFFQFVFAATASTIVSGAVAERTQFGSYLIYSTIITGFVYPVVSHWCWSGTGWLTTRTMEYGDQIGFKDFAGSAIVHCTGGIAALMGAIFIGPRIGKFSEEGNRRVSNDIPGHSVPIASLGAFILFLGFLAFNGGSVLQIVNDDGSSLDAHGEALAVSVVNTIIGGAAGSIFALGLNILVALIKGERYYWSLLVCINGGLAGMVSMCAACNELNTGAAFGIGATAGMTMYWVSDVLLQFGIDDPLDAFAVHYGGGVCGILLSPIFANYGIAAAANCAQQNAFVCDYSAYKQFTWNLVGLIAITLWSGIFTGVTFAILYFMDVLRVDKNIEIRGLDIKKHGEPGYPTAAYGHGWDDEGEDRARNAGDHGRRGVKSLAGVGFDENVAPDGLIALAIGHRRQNYKNPSFITEETHTSSGQAETK
ncbi:unnamed protein product [Oikopleura dioica]|uniref:Ammonium transporter AmtB-like domain-containing protein n=1 Tax=Oikopleura dioica TaxID=34765 RepID=E4Y0R3_OIKDI|nr:unnamed protein product [Oikopleura dioica]